MLYRHDLPFDTCCRFTGGDASPARLLVARLAPTAAAQDDDVILERDDSAEQSGDSGVCQEAAAATDSMHSEITLRQSSGSVASLTGEC
jgi:hypothetical protein